MRIGIDTRLKYYRPGGIAEYARHVVQELAALDGVTDYCVIHHRRDRDTLAPGANFQRINTLTPSHHRFERWALSVELMRHRLDLLHSPDMIPPQGGARRHIITVHDLHFLYYPQFMTAESRRHYKDQIAWAVRMADHILVSSHATLDDLGNLLNVPAAKMTVHMLGVNEAFKPLPDTVVAEARARLGLPETYILFVGTFEPRKNIPGLLDAYNMLRQDMPDVPPLVMAGRYGWLYDKIFAKVDALGLADHLIWLENPPSADLPAIYNGAVVLVLPSHYEGFGLPALEAMACGTPPVVANRSSLPEVVGDAGLLVDPDDPASIADAIRRVVCEQQLRARLRADGLARATTFTWRQTAEIALRVYRSLLS
ncbi:MAG: glycosyltransferase family 4 protein [Anaerolineae bacterium]|nr:glycosyltransferase family 4 protein [Anaerolineae bacterium]